LWTIGGGYGAAFGLGARTQIGAQIGERKFGLGYGRRGCRVSLAGR